MVEKNTHLYCKEGILSYMTKMRDDEITTHPAVLDSIEEAFGLFGKEKLDADELKRYLEYSRIKLG